jgi:hypothetical protein
MNYRFMKGAPVSLEVRRIVLEEIASASEKLRLVNGDEAIHEVRKGAKRVRALLKLVGLVQEAAAWRRLGRTLSASRDASAVLELLEELRQECPQRLCAPIRRRLMDGTPDLNAVIRKTSAALKRIGKIWPVQGDGFAAIEGGWRRTYRQGVHALREVEKDGSAENLHRLRRRAKEHYYQLRLVEELLDRKLRRHQKRVRRLEKVLGVHQNLVVLKTKVMERPGSEEFLAVLEARERHLAAKVLRLGTRVYRGSVSRMAERLKRLWKQRSRICETRPGSTNVVCAVKAYNTNL